MGKKTCPPGTKWDKLLITCITPQPHRPHPRPQPKPHPGPQPKPHPSHQPKPHPRAQPKPHRRPQPKPQTAPPTAAVRLSSADPAATLSPAVWVSVAVVVTGSMVALVLWCVIYRRQASRSNASDGSEPGLDPLAKTEPTVKIQPPLLDRNGPSASVRKETDALPSFPHLNDGAQRGLQQEEGPTICRRSLDRGGTEGDGDVLMRNTLRELRIPLPATELGDTALVTTKTV